MKPKIKLYKSGMWPNRWELWECTCLNYSVVGYSPIEAYDGWLKEKIIWEEKMGYLGIPKIFEVTYV